MGKKSRRADDDGEVRGSGGRRGQQPTAPWYSRMRRPQLHTHFFDNGRAGKLLYILLVATAAWYTPYYLAKMRLVPAYWPVVWFLTHCHDTYPTQRSEDIISWLRPQGLALYAPWFREVGINFGDRILLVNETQFEKVLDAIFTPGPGGPSTFPPAREPAYGALPVPISVKHFNPVPGGISGSGRSQCHDDDKVRTISSSSLFACLN
jgi:hypothetical protein